MKKINNELTKGYTIKTNPNDKVQLCRIINEYENIEEAKKDLVDLLTNWVTEEELLKEYTKKKKW
ncbi:MAG TPA: hypothetical protein VK071_11040 [Tissierellales bacterium]|nr:hypothetical protein [Tissierellales bacterium]